MIITCPQCDARFVVPSTVFMRGGRKMKCASCAHTWFQDEPLEKSEAVKTFAENLDKQKQTAKVKSDKGAFMSVLKNDFKTGRILIASGFAVAICVYVVLRLLSHDVIMGQGLAFDNIKLERENTHASLSGEIVNSMNDARGVPTLKVTELLQDNVVGNISLHAPSKDVLDAGETLKFDIFIDHLDPHVLNLKIGFEGGENQEDSYDEDSHEETPHETPHETPSHNVHH